MSTLCNTYNVQDHPTELTFSLTSSTTGCTFNIDDTTQDYNPPFSYGFYPELGPDPTQLFQYKRSWGYFINVMYWNKYNKLTMTCEAVNQTSTIIYEDGLLDLTSQQYGFNRDGFFTVYRIFVLKKTVLEQMKLIYSGSAVIVYDDTVLVGKLQSGVWSDPDTIVYSDIVDINDAVLLFETQNSNIKVTGTLAKQDIVSICYFTKCYEGLNILIVEQINNPCTTAGSSQFYNNTGNSLFGYSSVNCLSIYNNPNMFKRDFLFMLLTSIRLLVDRCEYVHAEKMIEEIIGSTTNAKCSLFTYLCGDTIVLNDISSGCGCR